MFNGIQLQSSSGISKVPGVCGGDACIRGTRIPVWVLEEAKRGGQSDETILDNYPTICQADLQSAWQYVLTHQEEIESQIKENRDA